MRNLRFPQPSLKLDLAVLNEFYDYCVVDERITERVSKDYRNTARRFLRFTDGVVSYESVRAYLERAPKTYNNQLCDLRAFVWFLRQPDPLKVKTLSI